MATRRLCNREVDLHASNTLSRPFCSSLPVNFILIEGVGSSYQSSVMDSLQADGNADNEGGNAPRCAKGVFPPFAFPRSFFSDFSIQIPMRVHARRTGLARISLR